MTTTERSTEGELTWALTVCDREPIHIPGSIQPHGVLLAIKVADGSIIRASENAAEMFALDATKLVGRSFEDVPKLNEIDFRPTLQHLEVGSNPILLKRIDHQGRGLNVLAHRNQSELILEFEPASADSRPDRFNQELQTLLTSFIAKVQGVRTLPDLFHGIASEIRFLTGFDRALVYRFDADGTGIVVGEDGNGKLPSLQDHRFPASDIPRQARELYRLNRVRLIPNSDYKPVAITPRSQASDTPFDLTFATLRSVSPVHVEYMRNMGTPASMSVSILRGGQLWGLVSCHHSEPRFVPFETRTACDLLTQVFALQLAAFEDAAEHVRHAELKTSLTRILGYMADASDFTRGLVDHADDLLGFVHAEGAAVVTDEQISLLGKTPDEEAVRDLTNWLFSTVKKEVFHTDSLAARYPFSEVYSDKASGLLAISVSKLYSTSVLWFRPEVIETIRWGGNPQKGVPTDLAEGGKIQPRRSFETWKETVRRQATPWTSSEIEAAIELRNAVLGIVLRKAEEMAALNAELERSNAELARSNEELEAFSYSVSHDLRAPLRHIVGYAELFKETARDRLEEEDLRYANNIIESSEYAGKLVDNLLSFSRMGRMALEPHPIDMNLLLHDVKIDVMKDAKGREIEWTVAEMPRVTADVMMLKLAVRNLLANAVKYTRNRAPARIEVSVRERTDAYEFSVKDNGVGFDMRFQDKLFGVFQRLHRWEDYEGTGIGLANVRRIVERHGGHAWAEGEVDRGATFYFTLPRCTDDEVSPC